MASLSQEIAKLLLNAFLALVVVCLIAGCGRDREPEWAEANFAEGPGRALRRTDVSNALLKRCLDIPNLSLRGQTPVRLLERTEQGICAQLGEHRALARLVVGADGLHSRVRSWAELQRPSSGTQRWGLSQHFAIAPWSDKVEVTYARGSEAYVWPTSEDEVGVSVLHTPKSNRAAPPPEGQGMLELLRAFPDLLARLRGSRSTSRPRGAGPLRQAVRSVEAPGVVLLGPFSALLLEAYRGVRIHLIPCLIKALEACLVATP